VDISCAFPTTLESPEHIAIGEELGYVRAWVYDTPQQSPDVWMTLALAARRTSRITIGPGVLVPHLRHPMLNAAATATLVAMAPGRVVIGFGTGFTGRRAMGYRAISWAYMKSYIQAYLGLLRGETIEWEGARMRMLHPEQGGAPRPIEVPIIIGALGPKGRDVARELGADGIYLVFVCPDFAREFSDVPYLLWGTVLGDGEDPTSERVRAAAGPGWALAYRGAYEFQGPDAVRELPGGVEWLEVVQRRPQDEWHLTVHDGHCYTLSEADRAAWDAGGAAMLPDVTMTGSPERIRERIAELGEQGVTEVVFQPCGPDIAGELERFAKAARG
jgi:5,10-methylenetetrahydromethanopterin reductase